MSETELTMPPEVEAYFVNLFAEAGRLGGSIGGGGAGARGGARGGAIGARLARSRVCRRDGFVSGTADQVVERVAAAFPKAMRLDAADRLRLAVPIGLTGMQQVVADLIFDSAPADESGVPVTLFCYGKEGLLSRSPTAKTTEKLWSVIIEPS
ncbi:MAG TPA: hypothetical protein VHX38_24180 [Pseudonocardiaceae bacterium]|jgi:hypothetical protein|nr:hypothetical protein [Pseudonocardiaceae bacterium]